jgi:hypothetical protein
MGSLVALNGETILLALVPVPLVHLALAEAQPLRDATYELARPVGALVELVIQDLQLLLVLALASLDVATPSQEIVF